MNEKAIVPAAPASTGLALQLSRSEVVAHVRLIQEVMQAVMKEGTHYGTIPGTPKPSLWKPGAEVLCVTFRIAPTYRVEDLSTADMIRYRVVCSGQHQQSGLLLGEGVGECSSMEEKYAWRKAASKAEFEHTPEDRRRTKFGYDKSKRQEYEIRQVRTSPWDVANTILKMASKRAQVAMAINVTAASDIFSQDLEDLPPEVVESLGGEHEPAPAPVAQPRARSEAAAPPAAEEPPAQTSAADDAAQATPISEGAVRLLLAKLAAASLTDAELCKRFGIAKLTLLKAGQMNDALAWIKNPNGGAA